VSKTIANVAKIDGNGVITRSIEIGSPKSELSYRAVPVPKDMLDEIDAHKLRQMKERMTIGIGGKPEYIFATETDGLYDGSNVHKSFSRILEKAGVPHKKFHSLRHTYASQLVRMGVQLSVIQKLMGHSDIATTTIYVHVSDQDMIDAVEVLSAWLK